MYDKLSFQFIILSVGGRRGSPRQGKPIALRRTREVSIGVEVPKPLMTESLNILAPLPNAMLQRDSRLITCGRVCVSISIVILLATNVPLLSEYSRNGIKPSSVVQSRGGPDISGQQLKLAAASLARGNGPASSPYSLNPFQTTATPIGRMDSAMAYDPAAGFVLMFGGVNVTHSVLTYLGDTWSFANGIWIQVELNGSLSPSPRAGALMAFDPADGEMHLFGGAGSGINNGDCWNFVRYASTSPVKYTYSWLNCSNQNNLPPDREFGGMVYDSSDNYLVMFGGINANTSLGDTWTYSGGRWSQIITQPGQAPSPRYNFSMVYDSGDGYVLLFGGIIASASNLNAIRSTPSGGQYSISSAIWEFRAGQWTDISSQFTKVYPQLRVGGASIYDAMDGYVLLFGGSLCLLLPINSLSRCSPMAILGDTWIYSNSSWSERYPSPTPSARLGASIAFDSNDGVVIMFGGYGTANSNFTLNDTWEFWAGGWSATPSPISSSNPAFGWSEPEVVSGGIGAQSGVQAASMTYDSLDKVPIMFGGYNHTKGQPAVDYNETLEYSNLLGLQWWGVSDGQSPSGRYGAAMTYDAADGYVVLFGGWNISGTSTISLSDTWTYTVGSGWNELHPSTHPSARGAAAMFYDPSLDKVVLFGGATTSGTTYTPLGDTWEFAGGAWTLVVPSSGHHPAARSNASMAYFPQWSSTINQFAGDASYLEGGYGVLFGGFNSTSNSFYGDTWEFNSSGWTQLSPHVSPSARADYTLAVDGVDGYLVLFGGQRSPCSSGTNKCVQLGDTWEYWDGNWTNETSVLFTHPSSRSLMAATYDPAARLIRTFGGTYNQNDSWGYWTNGWREIASNLTDRYESGSPSERTLAAMTYDGRIRSPLLFGGASPLVSHSACGGTTSYSQNYSDTWSFLNGYGTNITDETHSSSPGGRMGATMVYDERDGFVILFGGLRFAGFVVINRDVCEPNYVVSNSTWIFASNDQWINISGSVAPSPRAYYSIVYDSVDGYVLLFGGQGTNGNLNDTWVFSGRSWTEIFPRTPPPSRDLANMVLDASDGYVLLWGGYLVFDPPIVVTLNDTWTFTQGQWKKVTVFDSAPNGDLVGSSMFYVPDRQAVYMFGGYDCITNPWIGPTCNATWEYHAGQWTNLTSNRTWGVSPYYPQAMWELSGTTDYSTSSGFMFGGTASDGDTFNTGWYLT